MTLEWTSIDVPLGAGIDTKTTEKLLKPPACADLSDAVFPASGIDGYETRKGYDRIRTDTSITKIDALATRENELIVIGNNKAYSVSELTNNVDLIERGDLLAVSVAQETLDTQATNQTLGQIIAHGGVQVHCWFDSTSSTIKYTVADEATGSVISANNSIANSSKAKLARAGQSILVIYNNDSATSLRCTVIPIYAPTTTSDVEVVADMHTDELFDVVEASEDFVFVAYKSSTATTNINAFLLNESGTDSANAIVEATAAQADIDCISVSISGFGLNVAVSDGTDVTTYYTTQSTFNTIGTFTENRKTLASVINIVHGCVRTATGVSTDHQHVVWCEFAGATANENVVTITVGFGPAGTDPGTPTTTLRHCSLASTAFYPNTKPFVHVAFDSTLQRQYFLIDQEGQVQAKCCVAIGAGNITPHLPRVIDNIWAPVFREHLDIDVDPDITETVANVYAQYGLKKVTYDFTHRPQAVEYGKCSYIQSGFLWEYDGVNLVEQGFHTYPEGFTAVERAAGSLELLGSYSYRVYYEWINARGERQRSATGSVTTEVLTTSNQSVTLTVPTLSHTAKGAEVSIVVYRSEANPNLLGGSPMYRVSSPDPSVTGTNGYVANDPTVDDVTFIDELSDADLLTHELDYLNSGELDHVPAEVSSVIGESKGRVWVAVEDRAYYSKTNARGRDQLEFNDSLWVKVPEEGGDITAFGALNFHTVIFKETSCYAVSGEGRNNLGAGFFNLPQVVSLDLGCIEPRSVVSIPEGILFKSNKGIWRLGHNLDMVYVGANAEAYNDQDVTAATLVPDENHVLFLTSLGRTLVYNYLIQGWSTFTNHAGDSAALWNGTYTYARTDGKLYKQSGVNYSDDGVHYSMKFVTAPIGIKGVQGMQKIRHIRLLGQYYSPHELRVGLRFNHEPGVSDQGSWDPSDGITVSLYGDGAYGAGAYGGDGSPVYQARFNMPRQKCQTVQFVIDTKNTGGAGRAVSIQAIQIEVGAKRGTGELSVDRGFSASGGSTT